MRTGRGDTIALSWMQASPKFWLVMASPATYTSSHAGMSCGRTLLAAGTPPLSALHPTPASTSAATTPAIIPVRVTAADPSGGA